MVHRYDHKEKDLPGKASPLYSGIGLAGFEPATPSPPDLYAKPLRYSPEQASDHRRRQVMTLAQLHIHVNKTGGDKYLGKNANELDDIFLIT